jgi:nucleoside-diphosphate-sugar epimerase
MAFRVLIIGGTGQVGAAVVRALAAEPSCAEVVMVNRRAISLTADPRVRQVILDTAAAQFCYLPKLARYMLFHIRKPPIKAWALLPARHPLGSFFR